MTGKTIYLSGPIAGQSYGSAVTWRLVVKRALAAKGIECLSPMRHKDYLQEREHIGTYVDSDNALSSASMIYMRDRLDVQRCDLMLVYLPETDKVSIGTCIEIGWANAWGKPIICVMEGDDDIDRPVHDHPILTQCVGYFARDLPEAMTLIGAIL